MSRQTTGAMFVHMNRGPIPAPAAQGAASPARGTRGFRHGIATVLRAVALPVLMILMLLDASPAADGQPMLTGSNYWHWTSPVRGLDDWGSTMLTQVRSAGISFVRIGGARMDMFPPSDAELRTIVDVIRGPTGMAAVPMIQVPRSGYFHSNVPHYNGNTPLPQTLERTSDDAIAIARRWVTMFNGPGSTNPVRYWSIGNEMRMQDQRSTNAEEISRKIAEYFRPIAKAMKEIDPNIVIFGPDEAWLESTEHNYLFWNPANVDSANKQFNRAYDISDKVDGKDYYYCDGLAMHMYSYPTPQNETDLKASISNYHFNYALTANLVNRHPRNALAGSPDRLLWGISEFNAGTEGSYYTGNTFMNGQLFADTLAAASSLGATYAASWSITDPKFGLFSSAGSLPLPNYWHTKLIADNFTGAMAKVRFSRPDGTGTVNISEQPLWTIDSNPDWRVYANVDPLTQQVAIVILNHAGRIDGVTVYDTIGTRPPGPVIGLVFPDRSPSAPTPGTCAIGTIPDRSTVLLLFRGNTVQKFIYARTEPGVASNGLGAPTTLANPNPGPAGAWRAPAPTVVSDLSQIFLHEGDSATLALRLSAPPPANTTVSLPVIPDSQSTTLLGVAPATLTFTAANWNAFQKVIITSTTSGSAANA